MPIELAGIQLPRIHRLATVERADFASHRVPGLNGNLVQDLGRESVVVRIEGIFYGADAGEQLEKLREAYKSREPADFLADIVGQSYFSQVVIEQLDVWQRADEPEQFSYALVVREYVPPPQPATAFAEGLADVDTSILDEAFGFMDALALPDLFAAPGISDPTPPLETALAGVESALTPLEGAASGLSDVATPATENITALSDEGNSGIEAQRDAQVGALGDSTAALDGVQSGVESGVQDVGTFLSQQDLPTSGDPSAVQQGLANASIELPTDLSALTAPLNGEIDTFFQQLDTDLTQPLAGATQQFGRIGSLTKLGDIFSAQPANGPAAAPGNSPAPPSSAANTRGSRGPNDPTALETALADFSQRLDIFPNPFDTETLLDWLYEAMSKVPREQIPLQQIPIFDELRDKIETLRTWRDMAAPEFQGMFAQQLDVLAAEIRFLFTESVTQPLAEQATQFRQSIPVEALTASLDALLDGLPDLAQKTINDNLINSGATILELTDHVAQLRTALATAQQEATGESAHTWLRSLNKMPLRLEGQMLHLFTGLQPVSDLDLLSKAFGPLNEVLDGGGTEAAAQAFEGLFQQIRDLLAQLDLSVISDALDTVIGGAATGLQTLQNSLLTATLELAVMLDRVEQAVSAVPTEALVNGLRDGLTSFRDLIEDGVAAAFDAARRLIVEAFNAIEGFLQYFNPAALLEELKRILGALRNILESPELQGSIRQFKGALDEANNAIGDFSFKPVADVVVSAINAVETAIDVLSNIPLTQGIKDEIKPAVRLLPTPTALGGTIEGLEAELDTLLDDTIIPALTQVKDKLKELLDAARGFSPETYFTTYLVTPYEAFLQKINDHRPSLLLAPLQGELDNLKSELREAIDLEQIIATLDAPFADLFERFDAIRPEAFIEELEQKFQEGIRAVTSQLPLDEIGDIFDTISHVIAQIRSGVRQLTAIRTFLTDLHDRFGGLADARNQFAAIGERYAARLDDLTTLPGAETAVQGVNTALVDLHSAPLLAAVQPPALALAARLREADAKAKLVRLVAAHRAFPRTQLGSLPDSVEKNTLIALIDGFNPMHRDFSTPAGTLEDFADEIDTVLADLPGAFTAWDARWFAPGSPLTELGTLSTSAAAWQTALQETISTEFSAQLAPALGWIEYFAKFVDAAAQQLAGLLGDVEAKINELLDAGDRLGELRAAFESLIDTLENFDFSVVGREVGQLFAAVRAKLDALRPATLFAPVQEVFDDLLDFLDLDRLLGAAELDEHFQRIVVILEGVNPANVLPDFTALMDTIRARITDLDITPQIESFGQSLINLKADLEEQLGRTENAYTDMYEAIPEGVK